MLLAGFYAFAMRPESWSARQALIVRDDTSGQSFKKGRFDSLDSMKSAQETIFEIARKPQVIRNTLEKLGPPNKGLFGTGGQEYPSEETIEVVQGAISISAPNGAEFGRTEVIILNTKEATRERSKKFIDLLVDEIIAKVNEVRRQKFQSMEVELQQACSLAEGALDQAKSRMRENVMALGIDASVSLGGISTQDDTIKREIAQLNLEKRAIESELASADGILTSLMDARENPNSIVNISSDLAKRQPQLDSLKQELTAKKGLYAQEVGRYTPAHPSVKSARDAIVTVERQIRQLLGGAIHDTKNYISIQNVKLKRRTDGIKKLEGRLVILNESRAESMTLAHDLTMRSENLNKARSDLAEVQGLALGNSAALLAKVDQSQVSTRPDGMGKRAVVLCGGLGGLLLGIGLVMMVAPPMVPGSIKPTDSSKPALADVGLEKAESGLKTAKSGLNATANVIRDIIKPKANEVAAAGLAASSDLAETKPDLVEKRLSGIKTIPKPSTGTDMIESLNAKPTEAIANSLSDIQNAVSDAYSLRSEVKSDPESVKPGLDPVKLVSEKVESELDEKFVPKNNAPDAGDLATQLRAAQAKKTLADKPVAVQEKRIEPIDAESVEKAFEPELNTIARPESPTIDLASINSAFDLDDENGMAKGIDVSKPGAQAGRAAQIKPRSANIRPVNLIKDSDEFDRNLKEPGTEEPPQKREFKENPFLKDRIRKKQESALAKEDDSAVVPMPEQIKKLSESIANFAKPIGQATNPKDVPEKF